MTWAAPSTAEPAADAGVAPRELCRRRCRAPVRLGGLLRGGECLARLCRRAGARDGTRRGWQCSAATQCARVQNVRSGRAQSTHGRCSKECQRALESLGEAGSYQARVRDIWEVSGHAGCVRGSSPQCKPEDMPKLFLHTGCSTECHGQLGNSWGGQTLQILVSLGAQEGGKVSLAKIES